MIPIEIRNGVKLLRAQGQSLREISRLLKLSRNAVRRILREKAGERTPSLPCDAAVLAKLEEAFRRARGNGVRVQELLASEAGLKVPYSTLTRWIRDAELRDPPRRSGEYHQAPGEEMQKDTSPHRGARPMARSCSIPTKRSSPPFARCSSASRRQDRHGACGCGCVIKPSSSRYRWALPPRSAGPRPVTTLSTRF